MMLVENLLKGIVHVSIVVHNAEKTAEKLKKYGIGPFEYRQSIHRTPIAGKDEESCECTVKYGYSEVGNILWELIETVKGKSEYSEFLEVHGDGIHHLGFPTPLPLDAELDKWSKRGIEALEVGKVGEAGEGWAYMDTYNDVGFIMELLSFEKLQ
jgi:4-hydroxyphenylpyruvate dioxygenase-like putative hemolysin